MEEYKLTPKEIYDILSKKGVEYLHHANTVSTSITFIENDALLSRHFVEENGLYQSPQKSDEEDKTYDVWDHIFLDGEDLHKRYATANKYGPVLFRLSLDILNSPLIESVFVTKSNPWYWKPITTMEQKFYRSTKDLTNDYLTGKKLDSQIMFTLRNPQKSISLNKFLVSVEIDKPKLLINLANGGQMTVGDYAFTAIQQSLANNGLGHIPLLIRHTKPGICRCNIEYNYLYAFKYSELKKRFAKKP